MQIYFLKRHSLSMLIVILMIGSLAAASSSLAILRAADTSANQIEPKAGNWKTWVLTSGDQLRLPAPPDKAATEAEIKQLKAMVANRAGDALDTVHFWDTGSPAYRWNEIAINDMISGGVVGNMAFRDMTLMNVAIYDATIAAWDTKYTYNRPRPSELDTSLTTVLPVPNSPAYPSEQAVTAGAASAVLSYLFPDNAKIYMAKAEEAANSRLLAGVDYPSDVKAGLELGRKVAALVIERGKADGSDAKWTGSVPSEKGKWSGKDPIFPLGGTWKPWMLTSSDEFRPGPPPAYDSAQMAKEMDEVKNFKRTPLTNADANYWEFAAGGRRNHLFWTELVSKKIFEYQWENNPPRAAHAYAVFDTAYYDSGVACWDAKYTYWAIRPFQLDPEFKPLFTTPNHPGYPSAHGCLSGTATDVLSYLFPRDAQTFKALFTQIAESRIAAGIHFRSDIVAGADLGHKVGQMAIERAKKDGS